MNAVDKNTVTIWLLPYKKKSVLQSCMQLLITAGKLQRQKVDQPVWATFSLCIIFLLLCTFFFPLFQWGTQWVAGGLWSWRLQCTGCRAMMSQWSHFWQKLSECRELCTFLSKCTEIYCTLMGVVYSRMSSNRGHGMVRVWKLTDWHVTQHLANIKAN